MSVQPLLRRLGSRDGLLEATFALATALVEAERRAPAGDVPAVMRAIVDHYDSDGDGVIVLL
ncbi:hypothetical protein EKO23_03550 [Nocardioides guangzhouensis]|uniref:Uncharacterized protein n=1 Tax=Nocardioides guangzhouensis TaxID=2497878 RepID=A0A4Q4ZLE2_9ACTN|nr:hypothetical protein [Nocardioides guangzhouensis]RYP88411.1 hypothetical protein EKO23_03550 [Nocardioides guangzhouensis]